MIGSASKFTFLLGLGMALLPLLRERTDLSTLCLACTAVFIGYLYLFLPVSYFVLLLIVTAAYLPSLFLFSFVLNHVSVYIEEKLALKHLLGENLQKEFGRKVFHLLVLLLFVPIRFFRWFFLLVNGIVKGIEFEPFFSVTFVNLILLNVGGALLPGLLIENFRLKGRLTIRSPILRDKEKYSIAGYIYFLSAVFFLSLLFKVVGSVPENLLLGGIASALIYDTFSGLVGCTFGKRYIRKDRSLSGVVGGFTATVLTSIRFLPLPSTVLVAILLLALDILHLPINDNLYFPLGGTLFLLCWYLW